MPRVVMRQMARSVMRQRGRGRQSKNRHGAKDTLHSGLLRCRKMGEGRRRAFRSVQRISSIRLNGGEDKIVNIEMCQNMIHQYMNKCLYYMLNMSISLSNIFMNI
jgi:hypothetical protein